MTIYRYWSKRLAPLRVTVAIPQEDGGMSWTFHWTKIYGIGIGPWFIGCIRGEIANRPDGVDR